MLTVLQVIPELQAGGAERTTLEVAEAVAAAGGRALVASQGGRLERPLSDAGGELIRLPMASKNPLRIRANTKALRRIIRDEAVSVVHARSRAPAWSALWAARAEHTPFVTTYHGRYKGRSALKRLYNSVMARGDVVIANSQFIAGHIEAEHPRAAGRVTVIPRGVDLAEFDAAAVTPERIAHLRAAWDLSPDDQRPIMLMPGRITRWKGQNVAIDALAALRDRRSTPVLLVMPGDDQGRLEYLAELRDRIIRFGLEENVLIPGHCADMPAAFRAASIVVSASTEPEAFGRVAAEAQCAGRLVIASDHGGARETVEPAVAGWRTPPGDPVALADALDAFFEFSADERAARETAAAARARDLYATEALQKATLAVYGRITG